MATFLMFGKYSAEGVKGISSQRTKKAEDLIKKQGGQVKAVYAMLGMADLLVIVDLPGVEAAMQTSVALSQIDRNQLLYPSGGVRGRIRPTDGRQVKQKPVVSESVVSKSK